MGDETGVSGIGHVLDGVVFNDGTTVIKWLTEMSSIAIYKSFEEFKAIHIDSHPANESIIEMIDIPVILTVTPAVDVVKWETVEKMIEDPTIPPAIVAYWTKALELRREGMLTDIEIIKRLKEAA